eukprot:s488_g25.t1
MSSKPASSSGYQQEETSAENELAIVRFMAEDIEENQSGSSSEESDEGSDGEGGTDIDDEEKKSRDGDDKDVGGGGSSGAGGDGASSVQEATGASSVAMPFVSDGDFTDEDFEALVQDIEKAKNDGKPENLTTEQLELLRKEVVKRNNYYHQMFVASGKAIRKMEKVKRDESKKTDEKEPKEQKEPQNITINIQFSGKTYSVVVLDTSRMRQVCEALQVKYPLTFTSGKMTKSLIFEFNGIDTATHSRRPLGSGSTGQTGWKMIDGSIITAKVRGKGGAKRGTATRDDFDASSQLIMPLTPVETDHPDVKKAIVIKEVGIPAWLDSLKVADLKALLSVLDNQSKTGNISKLDLEKRVKLSQNYLRAVFAISYDKMTTSENGKRDNSVFYKAVRDRFVLKSDKAMDEDL